MQRFLLLTKRKKRSIKEMMNKPLILIFILSAAVISLANSYAQAAFSLSVTPYEGGYDLRYGKIDTTLGRINKEVIVNITSDIAKQYRLIQTLLEPLTNIQGMSISQNNLWVYGIRGTNKYGTLSVEEERPVSLSRTYIYTSNTTGLPDSFTLVYSLKGPLDVPPGAYRGRLGFTLEAIDATQAPVTVILNIFVEIEVESKIEIKTATGAKVISLNPAREETRAFDVLVDIKGSMGSQFKIMQMMNEPPTSSKGDKLSEEAVQFSVKEAKKGAAITIPTNLSLSPQAIYTSGPAGEPEAFIVTYSVGNLEKEKAGRYRTNLKYLLEGTGGYIKQGLVDTLMLEIENEPIFDLVVTPEMGGLLQFKNLKALSPPQINEIVIQVKTNIGKSYQVGQKIISEFISKDGSVIPAKYFSLRQESLATKGILKYSHKTEVKVGDMVLFVSDKEGSSDSFKVIYELGIPLDLKGGDYATQIIYSLSEI